jgi:TolA-binding protein
LAIASLYEEEGKWDRALGEYKKVKRDFPGTLPALRVPLHIAEYYQVKKKSEEAKRAYGKAVAYYKKLASGNKDTPLGLAATEFLADTYFARKDWEGGIKTLETIPANYPHVPRAAAAFYRIGRIYREQLKLPSRAIEAYRKYIKTYPGEANAKVAQVHIGQLYARQKDFSRAIKEYQIVLNKYPKDKKLSPSVQLAIASLYEEEGNWARARVEYEKVRSDFPKTLAALQVPLQIARYYQTKKKTEEAKRAYGKAVAYYKKLASGNRNTPLGLAATEFLANTYFSRKKWETGIKALQKLLSDYPNTPLALATRFRIAEVYQTELNQGKQAIRTYEEIRKRYPRQDIAAQALFQIAQVYRNVLKQPGQAKAIYRQFLADYPKHKLAKKVRKELQSLKQE